MATKPSTNLNYTERLFQAVRGPKSGEIAVLAITDTSASTDLSSAGQLGEAVLDGHYVNIISTVDCYFKFAPDDDESVDADENGSGDPENRADWLPAGVKESFVIPRGCPHFVRVGPELGIVRISLSSEPWPDWYRFRASMP